MSDERVTVSLSRKVAERLFKALGKALTEANLDEDVGGILKGMSPEEKRRFLDAIKKAEEEWDD
jgi:hypothetical protein